MKILTAQEMKEAEQLFANLPVDPAYKLKLPTDKEYPNISSFQSHIFPHASSYAQKVVKKLITLSDKMRSLSQCQPNSPFHMLTYTLISILYQDKYNASSDVEHNIFLLETIKCSLYSRDLDMKLIRNAPVTFQNKQLKLMVFRFFSFMAQPSLSLKTSRSKCAQWILTQNPLLLLTFTLFLRVILSKIGIEEADDFKKCVSSEETVTNLVEYFDLQYRSLDELILFYQDGIFLTIVEKEIVVGEYYLNENEKQNQKQQLQIKQSVKLNMIQSLLVKVDEKVEATQPAKKKGIVKSDKKLFNFMLENSSSSEGDKDELANDKDQLTVQRDKESQIQTPYFQDSNGQLNFFKNKKQGIFEPEPIKNQIHKFIFDNSQEYNEDEDATPTPYLGGEKLFTFINNLPLQIPSTQLSDVPPELKRFQNNQHPFQESTLNSVQQSGLKKIALENEKYSIFTSFISQTKESKQVCASTKSQKRCLQSRINKRENIVMEWEEICKCSCRKSKMVRNGINSKVVEVSVIPTKNYSRLNNMANTIGYMANTIGFKYTKNFKLNNQPKQKQEFLSRQRVKQTVSKLEQKNYLERKPAFLKNLKKKQALDPQTIYHQSQKHDGTKSVANQNKNQYSNIHRKISQERIKYNTLTQCIEEIIDSHINRSAPKNHKHQSMKTEEDIQKNNEKMFNINGYRSVVAKRPWQTNSVVAKRPWQTNSNLMQKVPDYTKINQVKSDIFSPSVWISSASPVNFLTPAQIIAPSAYVNSNHNNRDGTASKLKLKENKCRTQANLEVSREEKSLSNKAKGMTDVHWHRKF